MTLLFVVLLLLAFVAFIGAAFIAWRFDRWPGLVAGGLALWVLVDLIQVGQRLG